MVKVFIDGSAGTTGLRILERLENRRDLELFTLEGEKRKDEECRREMINCSDITILCLPDQAAKESVAMCHKENVRFIDASTAHRTEVGWVYGFPELSENFRTKIINSKRTAVPGCHASGFCAIVYPLIAEGIISPDFPVTAHSVTGFSGGGKSMIEDYRKSDRNQELASPAQYALTGEHKHLKEMKYICNLDKKPLFNPIVADFYSGMVVSVPIHSHLLNKNFGVQGLADFYDGYYKNEKLIKVFSNPQGFLYASHLAGKDCMEIYVNGNDDRITLSAVFCNLGKGASGAAVQCLNLMMGAKEFEGLVL